MTEVEPQPARLRSLRAARHRISLLLLFTAITLAMVRPNPRYLTERFPSDTGDPTLLAWVLAWGNHALIHQPLHYFDANIFWPHRDALAYSDMMTPLVPVYGIAHLLTGSWAASLTITNIVLVIFNLAATYALAKWLTRRTSASILGAVGFSFSAYVFSTWAHTQLLSLGFVSLCFLLLFKLLERPRWSTAIALGFAYAAMTLSALYYGAMFAVLALVVATVFLAARRPSGLMKTVSSLALAGILAGVLVAPAAAAYVRVENETKFKRDFDLAYGLKARDLVTAARGSYRYPALAKLDPITDQEHRFFPGFVTLALAALGATTLVASWRRPRPARDGPDRRLFLVLLNIAGFVALVVAHGPVLLGRHGLFWYLHEYVPGFSGIRATNRFAQFTILGVAMLAAAGFASLSRVLRHRSVNAAIAAVLTCAVLVELATPVPWAHLPDDRATLAVYRELRRREPGPVVELPLADPRLPSIYPYVEGARETYSSIDWNPRFNGYSGFVPPRYLDRMVTLNEFPSQGSIGLMRDLKLRYVIVDLTARTISGSPYDAAKVTDVMAGAAAHTRVARFGTALLVDLGPQRAKRARNRIQR